MNNYKIPLYDDAKCIGRVTYTDNLDQWDGHNFTSGSTGRHSGIGKTRSGQYFRVDGTQWQGERDAAVIISREEAQQLVLSADKPDLYLQLFGEDAPVLD